VWAHARVRAARGEFPPADDILWLPPPERLRVASLGHREALADLVWIRAVIFAGDAEQGRDVEWIGRYLDAILELAPTFRRPYAWGGVTMIYSGRDIDHDLVVRGISYYRRALVHFPEDHELLFALGMLLTREVQTTPGFGEDERVAAREEGAELIRKSAAFGAPPLVRQLAATLVEDDAGDQLAIQFLESQLLMVEDEGHRRLLEHKLKQLVGEQSVESIGRMRREFEAERVAELPYVSPDLYVLLRTRPRRASSSAAASEAP
jgi:hypothetical protein